MYAVVNLCILIMDILYKHTEDHKWSIRTCICYSSYICVSVYILQIDGTSFLSQDNPNMWNNIHAAFKTLAFISKMDHTITCISPFPHHWTCKSISYLLHSLELKCMGEWNRMYTVRTNKCYPEPKKVIWLFPLEEHFWFKVEPFKGSCTVEPFPQGSTWIPTGFYLQPKWFYLEQKRVLQWGSPFFLFP